MRWNSILVLGLGVLVAFGMLGPGCGGSNTNKKDGATEARKDTGWTGETGPEVTGKPDAEIRTDACPSLTCRDPRCFSAYCGKVGDGCGGALDCGACEPGWTCYSAICLPDICVPISCDTAGPFPYCGRIGDGCGHTLDCTCPQPDWTCVGHVCNGTSSGCVPLPGCTLPGEGEYCGGLIGDGCGGVLDCSRACSSADFVCKDHVCVDTRPTGPPTQPPPPPTLSPPLPAPPPPPLPPCFDYTLIPPYGA